VCVQAGSGQLGGDASAGAGASDGAQQQQQSAFMDMDAQVGCTALHEVHGT
jgi:hypothetical protein